MSVPADSAGKQCRCPKCKNIFRVPASKTATRTATRTATETATETTVFEKLTQETSSHSSEYPQPNSYHSSTPFYPTAKPKKNKLSVGALFIAVAGVSVTALIVGSVYGLWAIASQIFPNKPSDSVVELLDSGSRVLPRPTAEPTSPGATPQLSNDRMVDVALQFVALAQVPNSWEALQLLDVASFEKRTKGEKGSAEVQTHFIETKKLLSNFASRSFESAPANGSMRHWKVLGKTTFEGQPAVMVRYYCEPLPPFFWMKSPELFESLVPLITYEEFVEAAGTVFLPVAGRPGDFAHPPSRPDANGFFVPRAGYLLLCFESVDGEMKLVDLVNPMGQLRLSRAAGKLYLRDWDVHLLGRRNANEVKSKPIGVSIFGEIPTEAIDMGIELDSLASFGRYEDPHQKEREIGALSAEQQKIRAYRVHEVALHVDANSRRVREVVDKFRVDYPNDQGADLAMVCLTMTPNKLRIGEHNASVIQDSAERLYQVWRDPFLRYVQWSVAVAQGNQEKASLTQNELKQAAFETSVYHRHLTETAIQSKDKSAVLRALKDLGLYWNSNRTPPTPEQMVQYRSQWNVLADRLQGKDTGFGAGRKPGFGPPGPSGRPNSFGGQFGPGRESSFEPPRQNPNAAAMGPPPGFGTPGIQRGSAVAEPAAMLGKKVVISVKASGPVDSNKIAKALAAKLGVSNYQFSSINQDATLTLNYDGSLESVRDAIDFGTIDDINNTDRTIRVTIPKNP